MKEAIFLFKNSRRERLSKINDSECQGFTGEEAVHVANVRSGKKLSTFITTRITKQTLKSF